MIPFLSLSRTLQLAAALLSVPVVSVPVVVLSMVVLPMASLAAEKPSPPAASTPVPPLIVQMAGSWSVEQRMWPGAGAEPVRLPAAVARRRVVRGGFLEEFMESAPGAPEPFTRVAYLQRNAVTRRWEYVSLDSRAPQMMTEKSDVESAAAGEAAGPDGRSLAGDLFTAPRWGEATNVTFRYRLTVGPVVMDRQVVRLFLTPQAKDGGPEFLAFEYVYTRRAPAK